MNAKKRAELIRNMFENLNFPTLERKGHDYSGDEDVNSNFQKTADRLRDGIDKYDILMVYLDKHLLAINTWIKDREVKSEPITGRIVDAINYLYILWTMMYEDGLASITWFEFTGEN